MDWSYMNVLKLFGKPPLSNMYYNLPTYIYILCSAVEAADHTAQFFNEHLPI
jgi:hypothetical protein